MEKILIVGANGTTGKIIVDKVNNTENYEAVAMVRKEEQQAQFKDKGIHTVLADLENDVTDAVKGIDKIIFAAGSGGNTSDEKTILVDQEGAKKVVDAAKKANVKKFVMLSSIKADEPESNPDLSKYLKAKEEADEHLRKSGLKYTIVRPGTLTNDQATGKIKKAEKLDGTGKITREDVASVLVQALSDTIAANETFEMINGETKIEDAVN
ncbi:SDR family oxidoreductase [Flavimarina sp. Hel_I_48]|uniref:SDR family oxidoreductase n=1 Tax=Flavimarina sp. Hel_I_48 TaxID=1392488 RepID=UPI0004DF10EA|nr:SDR family oxidoreductase [Flavimarina sp. Hel_I_48]